MYTHVYMYMYMYAYTYMYMYTQMYMCMGSWHPLYPDGKKGDTPFLADIPISTCI